MSSVLDVLYKYKEMDGWKRMDFLTTVEKNAGVDLGLS
jgi:hypothetical protein